MLSFSLSILSYKHAKNTVIQFNWAGMFVKSLMLTLLFIARSVDRANKQGTNYGTEDKYSLVQQIHNTQWSPLLWGTLLWGKSGPIHLLLVGLKAGRPADKI